MMTTWITYDGEEVTAKDVKTVVVVVREAKEVARAAIVVNLVERPKVAAKDHHHHHHRHPIDETERAKDKAKGRDRHHHEIPVTMILLPFCAVPTLKNSKRPSWYLLWENPNS